MGMESFVVSCEQIQSEVFDWGIKNRVLEIEGQRRMNSHQNKKDNHFRREPL